MNTKSPAEQIALKQEPVSVTDDTATDTLDDFIERAMERIVSKNIDREKLKNELASDWDELDKRGIQVIRDIEYSGAAEPPVRCGLSHLSGAC